MHTGIGRVVSLLDSLQSALTSALGALPGTLFCTSDSNAPEEIILVVIAEVFGNVPREAADFRIDVFAV